MRMLRQAFGPVSLAMAFALAFTACGGGGGSSSGTPVSSALAIGTQPANATAAVGATATFNVVASGGAAPYTYQWSKTPKGGTAAAIPGATSAAYTTPALVAGDDGATFTVTVKDAANASVTSNAATLTIGTVPGALAVTLADQSVASGTPATFTPTVTGGKSPFTYAWKKAGATITGATGATYTTPATSSADDGVQYFVSVTDSATPAATATASAILHVTNPPLTTLFDTKLSAVPAVTFLLKKSDGTALGSSVKVDQRITVPGGYTVASTDSVADGATGHFRARTYPIRLVGDTSKNVGDHLESLTVSQDATLTYQASRQNWTVVLNGYASSPVSPASFTPLTSYAVDIYQCDSQGVVAWGPTQTGFEDPRVLTVTGTVAANANTVTFNTELFKGTYRAVFIPKAGSDFAAGVPLYLSDVITVAGGGVTNENQSLTLPGPSDAKRFTLKLSPKTGAPAFAANDFSVELRDKTSLLRVAYGKIKADGTVSFPTNLTDVIAAVTDLRAGPAQNKVVAVKTFTGLTTSTPTATLTQYNVKGSVTAPVPIPATAKVTVGLKSGLTGANWDRDLGSLVFPVTLATPSFDLNLFEGDWAVSADAASIPQCPDGPTVAFTLTADKADANVAIPTGGIITGTLQTKSNITLPNIQIDLVDPNTARVVKSTTSGVGGKYIFYVPYGTTYNLVVDSDAYVTTGFTASASSPTVTRDLVQYPVNGRITDGSVGIPARAYAGAANNPITAAADGTFTLKLFEGQNYVWINPPAGPSNLGPAVFTNVVVNSTTAP
ncbi:hypothetical protein [Geothrix sp. PMB-07]|uniref:hypothetical protein n=1 Tax=Geothrix sp. PMB-07 TaxID=3068640 RepID=UPI0027409436|nr:hypothetical protein [Geothrix sp. PMB-07]WLT31001.1 hypothetical protein Q9293_14885 [Geothrix sp. PMB-07]